MCSLCALVRPPLVVDFRFSGVDFWKWIFGGFLERFLGGFSKVDFPRWISGKFFEMDFWVEFCGFRVDFLLFIFATCVET